MFCKHDKRTKDIWQEFLTDKKNCEFFILYVYFITCKPFYCIIPKLWWLHDRAGCKTVFWSCLLRCAFLIVFNRIRIKAPLLTMTLPKNLEWQRFYARCEMENWVSVRARYFRSEIFFDRTRTPFLSRTEREADDKASFQQRRTQ